VGGPQAAVRLRWRRVVVPGPDQPADFQSDPGRDPDWPGLPEFVRPPDTDNDDVTIEVATAEGLFPEPFLHALSAAGFPLTSWLAEILGAVRPNAAHTARRIGAGRGSGLDRQL
jgi:hypothetical protein